jgi:hypothetical protein
MTLEQLQSLSLEEAVHEYVLAEQMQLQGILTEQESLEKQWIRDKIELLFPQFNEIWVQRKRASVSKGIIRRRDSLYRKLVEAEIGDKKDDLMKYIYWCIDRDQEPDQVIKVKILI